MGFLVNHIWEPRQGYSSNTTASRLWDCHGAESQSWCCTTCSCYNLGLNYSATGRLRQASSVCKRPASAGEAINSPRHPASGRSDPFKNPLYSPLQTHLSLATPLPPAPCHGGWPSPARPSRMKFQPRPKFEALAVRGGRIFRSKCVSVVFWGFGSPSLKVLEPPKAPGGPWRPLETPEGPWKTLEAPGGPWTALEAPARRPGTA